MKSISKKSRFRSAISVTLSLAMLLSLVAIPAFGAVDSTYVAGSLTQLSGATKLTSVVTAVYDKGLEGTVTVETSITPAVQAGFKLSLLSNPTLAGNVFNSDAARTIHVYAEGVDGSTLTTDVVCAASDTINDVLARIQAQLGPASGVPDDVKVLASRTVDSQPCIRLQKAGAPSLLQIWDDYTADTAFNGVVDLMRYGFAAVGQTGDTNTDARVSGVGVDAIIWASPTTGGPSCRSTVPSSRTASSRSVRSTDGVPSEANWNEGDVDDVSGHYTGISLRNSPGATYILATADRFTPVDMGKLAFHMGNGERDAAYNCDNSITNSDVRRGQDRDDRP